MHSLSFPDQVATIGEYAAAAKVHPDTVRRQIRAGKLPIIRIGRAIRIVVGSTETTA